MNPRLCYATIMQIGHFFIIACDSSISRWMHSNRFKPVRFELTIQFEKSMHRPSLSSDYWHLSFPLVNLCLLIRTPLVLCYQPIYGIGLQVFFCLVLINWLECAYQCIWLTISSNEGVTLLSACSTFLTMVSFGQTYPSKPNMSKKIWKKYSPISPRVLISPNTYH